MNKDSETHTDQREALKLKLPEPDVSSEKPWQDDVLNRKEIASRLTDIVRNQSLPFVISIHGEWGTGKTFLLKRWQRDMENQDFKAIYFNAWEDDFCDDPLLAIIGQLWSYFEKDKAGKFKGLLQKIKENAGPLFRANLNSLTGKYLGLTVETGPDKREGGNLIDEYHHQAGTKNALKKSLGEMAEAVSNETCHPLVFIIDELDRCRPTFAIELLERVKHILDVPNMVFVLGINRDELCKSLKSLYGEIDADVYLRRFFDMEFVLPEADGMAFCRYMMEKFEISQFFDALSKNHRDATHQKDVEDYYSFFPAFWGHMGLSLRDMDYCVRSIALAGTSVKPGRKTFPWLLGLLISLKLKNPNLYRQFIQHDCLSSQVMDYIDQMMPSRETMAGALKSGMDLVEGYLYRVEAHVSHQSSRESSALKQLELLKEGKELTHQEYLSERTGRSGCGRASDLLEIAGNAYYSGIYGGTIGYIAELIDLHRIPGRT